MEAANVKPLPVTQALQTLNFLHPDGEVFELCAINPKNRNSPLWEGSANGQKATIAGWFKDREKAAQLAVKLQAEGVFVTLNPCDTDLIGRAKNRLKAGVSRTADDNITKIHNLLIDTDPIRPSGVSSTDAAHEAALEMIQVIRFDLGEEGWPAPLVGDSANGGHLIYPVDLPNTPESVALIKDILAALSARYAKELQARSLSIDLSVYNPARLSKLYGTKGCKGDDTDEQPHRLAQIITLPQTRQPVPRELLEQLAATAPQKEKQAKATKPDGGRLDVEAYLAHYGVEMVKVKAHQGGQLYCLASCLFNSDHAGGEAAIFQAGDGPLSYKCFHNSCQGRTWKEARTIISGQDKLGQFMPGGGPYYSERGSSRGSCTGVCGDLEKSIREGTLTPEQKAYLIDLVEKTGPKKNLSQAVREWALVTSGLFFVTDCYEDLHLVTGSDRNTARQAIFRLEKDGLLEKCGEKRGCYRLVEADAEEILWKDVGIPIPVDLKQPLGLHELVYFYAGNIIIVGGTYNAGKTAYMLNTACLNMDKWPVNYLSSEMTPEELAGRLYKFKDAGLIPNIDAWDKVKFRKRRHNFHQVIDPDGLNIIDYLEITREFYSVGGMIDLIFQKLNKGIAVIAIQKAPGETHARGGAFTVEKARFAVSIDFEKLKVIKAKNLRLGVKNPTNAVYNFHIADGTKMLKTGEE